MKYDNVSFLGVEDKTVVVKKCGAVMGYDSGGWARRDAVLAYLAAADGGGGGYRPFRVGGSGDVQGVAQCVGDLDAGECQDCVATAVGRLRTDCAAAGWGDMFLGKCYARFSHGGVRPHGGTGGGGNGKLAFLFLFLFSFSTFGKLLPWDWEVELLGRWIIRVSIDFRMCHGFINKINH